MKIWLGNLVYCDAQTTPARMPALQTWRSAPRGAGIRVGNGDFPVAGCWVVRERFSREMPKLGDYRFNYFGSSQEVQDMCSNRCAGRTPRNPRLPRAHHS
jgi:hypothetical protein